MGKRTIGLVNLPILGLKKGPRAPWSGHAANAKKKNTMAGHSTNFVMPIKIISDAARPATNTCALRKCWFVDMMCTDGVCGSSGFLFQ